MANLHKIQAHLYDNVLSPNPSDYIARVTAERSLNVRDICVSAVARGGADVPAEAMEHAVTLARTHVEQSDVAINNPSEVMIIIPQLTAGTYHLEITTQFGSNTKTLLKEPRTAIFDRILTVV